MWIHTNCEDQQHTHIEHCKTSKGVWVALRQVHGTYSQGQLYFLKTKFFLYKAGASESIEDIKTELCRIREMIRNVCATEIPTKFDVAWALMNAVDSEAYNLVKYHLEEMKDLTLAYTVERMKAVEMKLKNTNTPITESVHKGRDGKKKKKDTVCYYCGEQGHIKFYCDDWLINTEDGCQYAKNHSTKNKSTDNAERSDEAKRPTNKRQSSDRRADTKKKEKKPILLTKKLWRNQSSAKAAQEKSSTTSEDDSTDEDLEDAGWMAVDCEDDIQESYSRENFSVENDDAYDSYKDIHNHHYNHEYCMAVAHHIKSDPSEWIIDSDASRHMTPMKSLFTKLNPTQTLVTIANGKKLKAEGLGEISVSIDGQNI